MTGRLHRRARLLAFRAATLAVVLLLFPTSVRAEAAKGVAVYMEGKGASLERSSLVAAMPESLRVADTKETEAAIRKAGLHGKIAALLARDDLRKRASRTLDKVTKALDVDAVIVGSAPERKGDRDVAVLVVRRGGETDFDTVTFLARDSAKARSDKWSSFFAVMFPEAKPEAEASAPAGGDEAEAGPPVAESAKPREPAEKDRGPESRRPKRERSRLGHALAVVGVAYDAGYRSFSYNDPVTENLRPYHVGGTPGIQLSAELYPFSHSDMLVLSDLAATARFSQAFSFESGTSDGNAAKTTWRDVELGLRYRIRVGDGESAPLLGIAVSYASSVFEFDGSGPSAAADELPGARYQMLRAGLDGRVPLGPIALLAQASYLQVLGVSPMSTRFPRESVRGVGGRLGAAMPLLPWLEARLEAGYDRLFYSFHPEPGDAFVAGGALDQHFSVTGGAFVVF